MYVFFLLAFFVNMLYLSNARPEPYTVYHKNFSTYSSFAHTYSYTYDPNNQPDRNQPGRNNYYVQNRQRNYVRSLPAEDVDPSESYAQEREDEDEERSYLPVMSSKIGYDETIVYPEPHSTHTRNVGNLTGYDCVHGFCTEASDYPSQYIENILNSTRAFDAFFKGISMPETIDNRFRPLSPFENVCRSTVNTTFPRVAMNTQQKQRLIANIEKYKQGVQIETCQQENSECQFSRFWPAGHQSLCEQKHTVVPLLALDDDMQPIVDTFLTPSCCVCMYKKI